MGVVGTRLTQLAMPTPHTPTQNTRTVVNTGSQPVSAKGEAQQQHIQLGATPDESKKAVLPFNVKSLNLGPVA